MKRILLIFLFCPLSEVMLAQRNISFKNAVPDLIFNDAKIIKANSISKTKVIRLNYQNDVEVDSFVIKETIYNKSGLPIYDEGLVPHLPNPKSDVRWIYDKFTDSLFYNDKFLLEKFVTYYNNQNENSFHFLYDSTGKLVKQTLITEKFSKGIWDIPDTMQIIKWQYNQMGQIHSLFINKKGTTIFVKIDEFKYDTAGRVEEVIAFYENKKKGVPYFFYRHKKNKIIMLQRTLKGDIDISNEYFFNQQSQCVKHVYYSNIRDVVTEWQYFYSYNENGTLQNEVFKVNGVLSYKELYSYEK